MSSLPQYGRHLHAEQTMRAMVIDAYGKAENLHLATVPRPVPGRGQVLVRTRHIGTNPKDVMVRKGKFRFATGRRFPLIIGHDIAGEVVEAGAGSDLLPGDRVFGMINDFAGRAYAQYAAVSASELALAPAGIDLRHAAAVPLAAQTALQALRDQARLTPGQAVLINGASGGVGVFAVQIARLLGARVTAVCSGRNADLVRELGATSVVDYTSQPPLGLEERFDAVFDVFGNFNFRRAAHLLQPRGCYVQTIPSGRILADALLTAGRRQRARLVLVHSRRAQLEWLREHIERGDLQVVLDRCLPLEQAPQAHHYLETKRARGKVVLDVD